MFRCIAVSDVFVVLKNKREMVYLYSWFCKSFAAIHSLNS